jgi:hypothetical protein
MEESTSILMRAIYSRGIRLSNISLPDSFLDAAAGEGKDATPKSKRSEAKANPADTPRTAIDFDSTPRSTEGDPVPNPEEGEQNRNLNEIFEQMEPRADSATIGSREGT